IGDSLSKSQHLPRPWVNSDSGPMGEAIQPADVAPVIVRAHQSVNASHLGESPINSFCQLRLRQSSGNDFYQCPEQRTGASEFHHVSITVSVYSSRGGRRLESSP